MSAAISGSRAAPDLRVGGLTPLTSIDYPGELAAVIYLQGCPWRCRYCHNPQFQARRGPAAGSWGDLRGFLERRRGLLDALVFSGGEPTLQPGLGAAIATARTLGFRVGLHTAGGYPGRLARLLPALDWVGLDLKAPEAVYPRITRVPGSGARAWDSARRLLASGVAHEIRVTVHPDLLTPAEVGGALDRAADLGARNLVLQACHPVPGTAAGDLPPADLSDFRALASAHPGLKFRA